MITIREQLNRGALVYPRTRKKITQKGSSLVSDDGTAYALTADDVPILLIDPAEALKYSRESANMSREYSAEAVEKKSSLSQRLKAFLSKDYRTKASREAFDQAIASASDDALCLSIGGGPDRPHPKLVNLNIGPFPNVDIVADAHQLPYADNSTDAIYCEAVLEHLENPVKAVEEMFRVLKPGGKIIAITPFLQAFHGYPNHFQNFTVIGHSRLFSRSGFHVVESGTCVGPMVTLMDLGHVFLCCYLPKFIGVPCRIVWKLLGSVLVPMGAFLANSPYGYVMASTTYVLANKPISATLSASSR